MVRSSQALLCVALLFEVGAAAYAGGKPRTAVPANADDRTITHVLNRLGYGPRPGDIERVRRTGLAAYIDRQLDPDRIDDDAMTSRLSRLDTLSLSVGRLAQEYFIPAMEKRRRIQSEQPALVDAATADARMKHTPSDAELRARKVMTDLVRVDERNFRNFLPR